MKKIGLMLVIFALCGQLEEIKTQEVPFGGKASQYAVVQMANSQGNYLMACPDCSAYAEISKDGIVYQKGQMSEVNEGLFTISLSGNYEIGRVYFMRALMSSPTYGNGTADSYITVIGRDIQASAPSSPSNPVSDTVSDAIAGVFKPLMDLLKPIITLFNPVISILSAVFGALAALWDFVSPVLATISSWMLGNLKDFIRDPAGAFKKDVYNAISIVIGTLVFTFGGITIVTELIGLIVNINHKNPVKFLSGMVRYNISVVNTVGGVFWKIGGWFASAINMLRNIKTGTVGDAI